MRFNNNDVYKTHLDEDHFAVNEQRYQQQYSRKGIMLSRKPFQNFKEWVGMDYKEHKEMIKRQPRGTKIRLYDVKTSRNQGMIDYDNIVLVEDYKEDYSA